MSWSCNKSTHKFYVIKTTAHAGNNGAWTFRSCSPICLTICREALTAHHYAAKEPGDETRGGGKLNPQRTFQCAVRSLFCFESTFNINSLRLSKRVSTNFSTSSDFLTSICLKTDSSGLSVMNFTIF